MRSTLILAMLVLAGCSGYVSLEQLEKEAMITGDWSAVEKRERIIARRNMRAGIACPPGTIGYCESSIGSEDCRCVDTEILSAFYGR